MKHILFTTLIIALLFSCKSQVDQKPTHEHAVEHLHEHHDPADRLEQNDRPTPANLIEEMDANRDDRISTTEAKGPLQEDFSNLDTDNDGFLTTTELSDLKPPQRPEQTATRLSLSSIDASVKTIAVNTDYFIQENIIGEIKKEIINLSGIETLCYVIKTHSQATEHQMGPWCPTHIDDGMEKAGIWFKGDKVYDVSGHFIANLDEFYSDEQWKLYREDGTVRVTDTKEGCLAAAKPDVKETFNNYCVECLPEYFKDQVTTFVIPVKPQYLKTAQSFDRGGIGVAFNGVKYEPPAPTHAILAAHTIAPLDDHGGHVNPHGGYHYHAVTNDTKEQPQSDLHSPMLGFATDGFGIYALTDENGGQPTDLDECGGHSDAVRGYHYHAGEPGKNQIIKCLHGLPGYTEVEE